MEEFYWSWPHPLPNKRTLNKSCVYEETRPKFYSSQIGNRNIEQTREITSSAYKLMRMYYIERTQLGCAGRYLSHLSTK